MTSKLDPYSTMIFEDIKKVGIYDKPKVDYHEFRTRWLALFSSATAGDIAPLGEWIQEKSRGNPFLEVEVWKNGNVIPDEMYEGSYTISGGEYVFTVPAILNNQVNVNLNNGKTLTSATIHAAELSKRLAVAGNNYIQKNVLDALVIEVEDEHSLSNRMSEIFDHFGIERKSAGKKVTEEADNTVVDPELRTSNNELDFDF